MVDTLRRLVGASLLQVQPDGASRYRLLETMRLYAKSHLHDAGTWEDCVERHDRYYHDQCRSQRSAIFGTGRTDARLAVEAELTEYEAAFDRRPSRAHRRRARHGMVARACMASLRQARKGHRSP